MNKKYNYLIDYLTSNINKKFDECTVFETLKFSLEQNVDYLYFFIANDEPIKYTIDPENPKAIEVFETSDYNEIETDYPIVTDRFIPVISSFSLKNKSIIFRNVNHFYIAGIARVPLEYWRLNPAINNYQTLLKNSIKHTDIFTIYNIPDDIGSLKEVFTTDISTVNGDLEPTILINTHTGKIANKSPFTDITWVDLDLVNHNEIVRATEYIGSIEYATAPPQKNNMLSSETIKKIINATIDGAYTNTYARTAHNIYNPYIYNFNSMSWYSWINFINNQYDNGVLVTEHIKNIRNVYTIYEQKYIDTYNYPKKLFKKIPYYQVPNIVREDPEWKNVPYDRKIKYLNDNCKKIKYNWYTKDTLLYVCCEHTYCNLLKNPYPKGLIIRENGQEICKNCGEILGNYDDENAFIEGMTEITSEQSINYTWRDKQDEKVAKKSWDELSKLVEAVDPSFVNNTTFVNKFIQMYHNKNYVKTYSKYNKSQFNFDKFDISMKQYIKNNGINNLNTAIPAIILQYINNDYIVKIINKEYPDIANEVDKVKNNEKELLNIYNQQQDPNIKSLLSIAISTIKAIKIITKKYIQYIQYESQTARNQHRNFRLNIISNFFKNIFKKSNRFFKLLTVMLTIAKIKSTSNEYVFDFNAINWTTLFRHENEFNEMIAKDSQKYVVLNLYSFENNPEGRFIPLYLSTNNIEEYLSNISIVNWINKFFAIVSPDFKIRITLQEKKIEYNNSVFERQQELISQCYEQLRNEPLINNVNGVIINKVINAITCPDILTRKFNSKKSFQQLCKSKFPTNDEYFKEKQKSNIIFNVNNKLIQYYYIDIVQWINKSFIQPLESILFDNENASNNILQEPSIDNELQRIMNLKNIILVAKNSYDELIQKINIPNECNKLYNGIRDLIGSIEVGINTMEKLYDNLQLILDETKPINNYTQQYDNINGHSINNKTNTFMQVSVRLIEWYMMCIFAEDIISINNVACINKYNILNNSINNFYNFIFVNNITYNLIKNKCYTTDELINQFVYEFFVYNNLSVDILREFFKNLRMNTQLFISPDHYIDSNIKTKRYIKRANNLKEYLNQQELDLEDLDTEERGSKRRVKVDNDTTDFLHLPEVELEPLTQNELIGGEIDNFTIDDEDMY